VNSELQKFKKFKQFKVRRHARLDRRFRDLPAPARLIRGELKEAGGLVFRQAKQIPVRRRMAKGVRPAWTMAGLEYETNAVGHGEVLGSVPSGIVELKN
jgi:hypothetical protein